MISRRCCRAGWWPALASSRRLVSSTTAIQTPPLHQQRVVDVAIVGLPNAGKSSLLNALLARRMAAVSKKRNTTRTNLLAVASDLRDGVEVSFYDTPGFVHWREDAAGAAAGPAGEAAGEEGREEGGGGGARPGGSRVERSVMVSAREAAGSVDVTLVVVDAARRLLEGGGRQLQQQQQQQQQQQPAGRGRHREHLSSFLEGILDEIARRKLTDDGPVQEVEEEEEEEEELLARRMASCIGLVMNKVDLVTPKPLLLPATMQVHDLLLDAIRRSAAAAVAAGAATAVADGEGNRRKGGNEKRGEGRGGGGGGGGGGSELQVPVFMVSALESDGLRPMKDFLHGAARKGAWGARSGSEVGDEGDADADDDDDDDDEDPGEWGELGADSSPDDGRVEAPQRRVATAFDLGPFAGGRGGTEGTTSPAANRSSSYDRVSSELDDAEWAAECIREKVFTFVHKEVPYRVAQKNRLWQLRPLPHHYYRSQQQQQQQQQQSPPQQPPRDDSHDGHGASAGGGVGGGGAEEKLLEIHQDLVVATRSHKRMVIGPKGQTLRRIEAAAQEDMAAHFGTPVRLRLWVREQGNQQQHGAL